MKDPVPTVPTLESALIPDRAEAARRLGEQGGPPDLERLLQVSLEDKSSGVRLAAAAAAADILGRHRAGPDRDLMPHEARLALYKRFRGLDPGQNTGLFQVIGEIGLPEAVQGLTQGLRDPRVDVRTGALVGLERLCRHPVANGDSGLEQAVTGLLRDKRHRPETLLELARLVVRMGYTAARADLEGLLETLPPKYFQTVQDLLDDLTARCSPSGLFGAWFGAGEGKGPGSSRDWRVFLVDGCLGGLEGELSWTGGRFVEPRAFQPSLGGAPIPYRRVITGGPGGERVEVLQVGDLAFREASEKDLLRFLPLLLEAPPKGEVPAIPVAAVLGTRLSPKPLGVYGRGLLACWTGDWPLALDLLSSVQQANRVPPEVHWFQALALRQTGADATTQLQAYVEKAGKKAPYLASARALLGLD